MTELEIDNGMSLVETVNRTFRCILGGRLSCEIDDTLLQKLLSKLESSHEGEDVLQSAIRESQVLEYVQRALGERESSSAVLSFAFQLLAVFVKAEVFDVFGQEHAGILDALSQVLGGGDSGGQKHLSSSVRASSLLCLTAFLHKETGTDWVLKNGLTEYGWRNVREPSVFVQRAAENFLSLLLRRSHLTQNGCTTILDRVLDTLSRCGEEAPAKENGRRMFVSCVNILATSLADPSLAASLSQADRARCLHAFKSYPLEDETADKLNRTAVFFLDERSYQDTVQDLLGSRRLVSALRLTANFLSTRVEVGSYKCGDHVALLASPLHFLTRRSGWGAEQPQLPSCLSSVLQDKASCRKAVAASLAGLTKALDRFAPEHLLDVLKTSTELMELCRGKNKGDPDFRVPLTRCPKTLSALLCFHKEALTRFVDGVQMDVETADHMLSVQVELLEDLSIPPAVFQSSCGVVGLLLPHVSWARWQDDPLAALGRCLSRRLLDRHWEVVDTVLELCTLLLPPAAADGHVLSENTSEWFLKHDLHLLPWDMLSSENSEGYVRAACLRSSVALTGHTALWTRLSDQRTLTREGLLLAICNFLTQDSEVFVQREAVKSLSHLLRTGFCSAKDPPVATTLSWAMTYCLDWEVKVTALQCCQTLLERVLHFEHSETKWEGKTATEKFQELFQLGCLGTLACALRDCDRPVKLLAAEVVSKLKERVQRALQADTLEQTLKGLEVETGPSERAGDGRSSPAVASKLETDERDKVVDMVVDIDMHDRITAVMDPAPAKNATTVLHLPRNTFGSWQEVVAFLWHCDLECIVRDNSASTDLYEDNLTSLLEDILLAVEGQSENEEYQAIDCY